MYSSQDEDKPNIDDVQKLQQFRSNAIANGINVSLPPGLRRQAYNVDTTYNLSREDFKCFINHAPELMMSVPEIQRRAKPKYLQTSATAETSMADVMSDPVHGDYLSAWLQYPPQNAWGSRKTDKDVPPTRGAGAYKDKIGYLSLPGEIRNRIMWFALVPGDVFPSHESRPSNRRGSRASLPACQLIATCRQAYLEGHESFYSHNTFHLAPGRLSASIKYFASLRPEHQCLISSFCIDFSILDLAPSVIDEIEQAYQKKLRPGGKPLESHGRHLVTQYVLETLRSVWIEKIVAIGKTLGIKRVELRRISIALPDLLDVHLPPYKRYNIVKKALIMEGPGIASLLNPLDLVMSRKGWDSMYLLHDSHCRWDDKIQLLLDDMLSRAESVITARLVNFEVDGVGGWGYFKEWLRHLENCATEEYTYSQVDEDLWNKKRGWHAGRRSQ